MSIDGRWGESLFSFSIIIGTWVSSSLGELFNRLSAVLSDFSVNNDVLKELLRCKTYL
jgi:hypothetical protein